MVYKTFFHFTRMGGIRYKSNDSEDYINASEKYLVPPIESLRALCDACHEIESAEERNELPAAPVRAELPDSSAREPSTSSERVKCKN